MPAVISSILPAPDSNVTLKAKHHHLSPAGIYPIALAALVVLTLVRFAAPTTWTAWTWLKIRERRNSRKDYGRNILARPSGFAGFAAGAGPPAQGITLRQAIWMTDPAMDKSRGVSSNAANDISQDDTPPARGDKRSPSPPNGPDGEESEESTMEAVSWPGTQAGRSDETRAALSGASIPRGTSGLDFHTSRHFMARPPPPPPLTPPTLSTSVFTFEDRRPSYAVSIPGDLDGMSPMSFLHQPNPDYTAGSSSADAASSPSTPHRRSYTKTLPIGIPNPSSSSQDALSTPKATFSPSSFPSTSQLLPPPPPGHHIEALHDGTDGAREIDLQGEIISVVDDSGAGWKRHTRVYGGGVCLACMAAGGGGFYGDKVPPEHRR